MRVISEVFRESQSRKARAMHADPAYRMVWLKGLEAVHAINRRRHAARKAAFARRAAALLANHPALCRPRVRAALLAAAEAFGVELWEMIGPNRRQTRPASRAQRSVIAELYEPAPGGGSAGHAFHYGIAELGRVLGLDHSTVRYAVRQSRLAGASHEHA